MVDALPPTDQVLLLRFLVPRLADAMLAGGHGGGESGAAEAWREFRRIGERLAAIPSGSPGGASLTQAVTEGRR